MIYERLSDLYRLFNKQQFGGCAEGPIYYMIMISKMLLSKDVVKPESVTETIK